MFLLINTKFLEFHFVKDHKPRRKVLLEDLNPLKHEPQPPFMIKRPMIKRKKTAEPTNLEPRIVCCSVGCNQPDRCVRGMHQKQ